MTLAASIVRRGVAAAAHGVMARKDHDDGDHKRIHLNPLAALIFFSTCMLLFVTLVAIGYTYGHLIPTLCMVESPETSAYVPVEVIDPTEPPAYTPTPKTPGSEDDEEESDPEILLVLKKPVTASLRGTIQHLRGRAGRWSRFRGLSIYVVWKAVTVMLVAALSAIFSSALGVALAVIIAEIMLARWHMAWVHIVISEPSAKRWYQRIPPLNTWRKIAPAVAVWALCDQIVSILPMLAAGSFGSLKHMKHPHFEPGRKDLYGAGAQGFLAMFLMLALFVLLQVPATVMVVRVAASMLPEEDETIVSFDRTFGGKTTPTIIGGQGKIGMVEAWTSFSWASRMRLVRLITKVALLVMAVWMLFTIIVVAEAHILFGENLGELMKAIHRGTHRS